jgi:copper chaperone CopZ
MAYLVVALAAAGIAIMIIKMPDVPPSKIIPGSAKQVSKEARVMTEAGELTLSVPGMHCPFACYPAIKKTLEGTENVESVELAEQKEEGVIDNPQVIVQYKSGFNLDQAIKLLDDRGFRDSEIVQ